MRALRLATLAIALAASIGLPATLPAQTTDEIARAQALLVEAGRALKSARDEDDRLAALGRAVTAHEAALSALRAGLRTMTSAERSMAGEIDAEAFKLQRLLAALQSVSRAPVSVLVAAPGGPLQATRSAMLMASVAPELDRTVAALGERLETLHKLRSDQETARAQTRETLTALQDLRARTANALERRDRAGLAERADLRTAANAAAARADDLDSLATILRDEGLRPGSAFRSAALPVAGRITARFGEPDPWGRPGYGWTLEAPAFAQVTAPWDATIRFAGPLTDYRQVVVIEPEAGYLLVLAGLANVDRSAGETVLAGEKLGDLGGTLPTGDEILLEDAAGAGQIRHERLYLEIRRSGKPVDPADWFDGTGSEAIR